MNRKPELTKEESEGFNNYVAQHYIGALKQAVEVIRRYYDDGTPNVTNGIGLMDDGVLEVFDKIATPRVFLIDSWRKLSSEEHMVYSYPDPVEREKAKAEAMRISKQVGEMIQG